MDSNLISKNRYNIAHIKLCTETEGPFKRCCIWFQGCDLHCPGCCNASLQSLVPNHIMDIDELMGVIEKARVDFGIEGITLSGGEPILQKGLSLLLRRVHNLGLGIILFSGRTIDYIPMDVQSNVDLLIDGPFLQEEIDHERVLLGSKNKQLHFLTDRYVGQKDYFNNSVAIEEVSLGADFIFINGD